MNRKDLSPIVIGGVGGSGTRLIARILKVAGFYMGDDLNEADDNLWFTLLFKRRDVLGESTVQFEQLADVLVEGMVGTGSFSETQVSLVQSLASVDRPQHSADWLAARVQSLLASRGHPEALHRWGWKEPNSHIVLDRLIAAIPKLRYIHVARNGLDMAYSRNQNQLCFWGADFLGTDCTRTPYYSVKFWRIAHERVLEVGRRIGSRFLLVSFDSFCQTPQESTRRLLKFVGVKTTGTLVESLARLARSPGSVGRFKQHGLDLFDPDDVRFVRSLGFDTDEG